MSDRPETTDRQYRSFWPLPAQLIRARRNPKFRMKLRFRLITRRRRFLNPIRQRAARAPIVHREGAYRFEWNYDTHTWTCFEERSITDG